MIDDYKVRYKKRDCENCELQEADDVGYLMYCPFVSEYLTNYVCDHYRPASKKEVRRRIKVLNKRHKIDMRAIKEVEE